MCRGKKKFQMVLLSTIESILLRGQLKQVSAHSSVELWHRIASRTSLFFAVFCLFFFPPPLAAAVCFCDFFGSPLSTEEKK